VPDPRDKILTHAQVDQWVAALRREGRTFAFTCGSFDLLHAGHVQYLNQARELCDALLVAVNSDDSVRRYKSPLRPVNPEEERAFVVAGLASVDRVTTLEENRPLSLLLRWKPDVYVKGGDYAVTSLRSGEAVREYGGEVRVIQPEFRASSSRMMERIQALAAHAAPERAALQPSAGLVLLDRDGTLIRNVPFLSEPARVELMPGAAQALAELQAAGYLLAIVSNQQGIGLGYFGTDEFIAVNQRIFRELGPHGVWISKIYYCPHSAAETCGCRKPRPGMLERAMRDFAVPPERCFFVGDTRADMEAGAAAGCATVYVGAEQGVECSYAAPDLAHAARWILASTPAVK
jgi:rfaE bifunctional protein nucleotidyltransferase chain/domain